MHKEVKAFLKRIGSNGGKARAARNSKRKLSEWGKLGGRPRLKKMAKRTTAKRTRKTRITRRKSD